jgi:hypothetical protein
MLIQANSNQLGWGKKGFCPRFTTPQPERQAGDNRAH